MNKMSRPIGSAPTLDSYLCEKHSSSIGGLLGLGGRAAQRRVLNLQFGQDGYVPDEIARGYYELRFHGHVGRAREYYSAALQRSPLAIYAITGNCQSLGYSALGREMLVAAEPLNPRVAAELRPAARTLWQRIRQFFFH